MASSFQFLHHHHHHHHHHLLLPSQNQIPLNSIPRLSHFTLKCNSEAEFPVPVSETTTKPEEFPMERRRKSEIIRDRNARKGLMKPEPPNFEIGWKRSKEIPTEKPTGYVVMDFLEKLVELMERDFGSAALLAKVGEIVAERATQEAELLREEGKVEDRMLTELSRVLKLMEMDLAMLKAAVKEDTFNQRLQQAKARCRQAILVANSF